MKYLYSILAIVVAASLLSLFFLWPNSKIPKKDTLFTINGQKYTRDIVTSQNNRFGYHSDNNLEMINTVISRELLIQEAQKQAIDKEATFRASLKNYYENGLIKILLDRKNDATQVEISDEEIDRYISFLNTIVSFTRLEHIPKSDKEATQIAGVSTTSLFNDLAIPVRILLSSLSPGSFKIQFDTGSEQYAIRLDKVEPTLKKEATTPDRKKIRLILAEFKKEQMMNEWYNDLRKQASITIHNNNN